MILVLFLLVGGVLAFIIIQNLMTSVHVAMFIWQIPSISVGLLVLSAFLLGALLLYVVSALSAWKEGRELKTLRKRVTELEMQLSRQAAPAMPGVAGAPMPSSSSIASMPTMPMQGIPDPQQRQGKQ